MRLHNITMLFINRSGDSLKSRESIEKDSFDKMASEIHHRHKNQTPEDVQLLNAKYKTNSIFPKPIGVWDAIEKLGLVSDPTDKKLYGISQWIHTLQVVNGMENDNIKDELLYVTAWIHDLGKILLLSQEDPANIVCDNHIIQGEYAAGLDNCVIQWNHDEFIYLKLENLIPDEYRWLIRYHSISLKTCEPYFNTQDRLLAAKHLIPFRKYDKGTKSLYNLPRLDLDRHRRLIEKHLPSEILI